MILYYMISVGDLSSNSQQITVQMLRDDSLIGCPVFIQYFGILKIINIA